MQPQYVTNILIVEDSDLVRNMVSNYLVQLGYDVTEAVDGLTGFDLFCVNPPNILITDIQMPGMDGLELCRRVRLRSNVPIILLNFDPDALEYLPELADQVTILPKPFTFDGLRSIIDELTSFPIDY